MSLRNVTSNPHVFIYLLLLNFKSESELPKPQIPCATGNMTNSFSKSYLHFTPESLSPNAMGKDNRMDRVSPKSPLPGLSKHSSCLFSLVIKLFSYQCDLIYPDIEMTPFPTNYFSFLNHLYSLEQC